MNSVELFSILSPFFLLTACASLAWWSHREALKDDREMARNQPHRRVDSVKAAE